MYYTVVHVTRCQKGFDGGCEVFNAYCLTGLFTLVHTGWLDGDLFVDADWFAQCVGGGRDIICEDGEVFDGRMALCTVGKQLVTGECDC